MPEWERVPLGDLLVSVPASRREAVVPDKKYRLLGVRLNNEGAFLRETKKGSESSAPSLYRVESGDFIYSRLFAWRGAFGLIPPELDACYVSNEFPLFRAKDDRLDLEWLDYWFHLQDVIRTVEADCTGSTPLTRNRYKETFFLSLEIPLPPLPEQQRIVARVKGLLDKVEEATRLREETKLGLVSFHHTEYKRIFEEVSKYAETVLIGDACRTTSGGTPSRSNPAYYDGNIAWIKSGELNEGYISQAEEYISDLAIKESSAKVFPKGTLLLAMYGATVGKTAVLEIDAATNQAICALFPKDVLLRDYLWWYLKSMRTDFIASSFGGAQPNISQQLIRNTQIPLPSLETQEATIGILKERETYLNNLADLLKHQSQEPDYYSKRGMRVSRVRQDDGDGWSRRSWRWSRPSRNTDTARCP